MLLTMDIGNTNINIGLFDGDDLTVSLRLATERQKTDDQYAMDFTNIFVMHKINADEISGVVISSVVPEITESVTSAIKKVTSLGRMAEMPNLNNEQDEVNPYNEVDYSKARFNFAKAKQTKTPCRTCVL